MPNISELLFPIAKWKYSNDIIKLIYARKSSITYKADYIVKGQEILWIMTMIKKMVTDKPFRKA